MQDLGLKIDNRSIVANSVRTASVDILDNFSNFAVVSSYCSADLLSFAIHCSLSLSENTKWSGFGVLIGYTQFGQKEREEPRWYKTD